MSALLEVYRPQRDGVMVPPIVLWVAFSMLVHLALLLWNPPARVQAGAPPDPAPLTVVLRPQTPPEVAPPPVAVAPPPAVEVPKPTPRQPVKKPPPAVIARPDPKPKEAPVTAPPPPPPVAPVPAPVAKVVPPVPPPAAVPAAPPAEADLSAYIEAQRRKRGELPADTAAIEAERANRGIVNSAALKQAESATYKPQRPSNGYGSFDIRRRGVDYAEYMFRGWNENFRRDGLELIEVRQGNHASIDLAVVRSIIAIIRRTESGDFRWASYRLGRTLNLSARPGDNAFLEEFMLQEFYDDLHRYR